MNVLAPDNEDTDDLRRVWRSWLLGADYAESPHGVILTLGEIARGLESGSAKV